MKHGIFIDVEVSDAARGTPSWRGVSRRPAPSTSSPPRESGVEIVRANLDECVLCELCLDAAPPGAVRVVKLYDDGAALERRGLSDEPPASRRLRNVAAARPRQIALRIFRTRRSRAPVHASRRGLAPRLRVHRGAGRCREPLTVAGQPAGRRRYRLRPARATST